MAFQFGGYMLPAGPDTAPLPKAPLESLPLPGGFQDNVKLSYWRPHPRQEWAMNCPADEIFFGGAKGGGKSDWLLADFAKHAEDFGYHANGIIFRRTLNEFSDLKLKANSMYRGVASWSEKNSTWTWPSGAWLRMRYLDADRDVGRYQGHAYSWVAFDELTEWPNPEPYLFMFTCMRSAAGVPCYMRATGNPGRPGQGWVRARFIEPSAPMTVFRDPKTNLTRVFIPAKLTDNPHLANNDPTYVNRLQALNDPNLVKALLHGEWDVFVGQAFSEWNRDVHVVSPFSLNPSWPKWCSMDWGYDKPFAILYFAAAPNGHVYMYRESYGTPHYDTEEALLVGEYTDEYNKGARAAASEVARREWNYNSPMGVSTMVVDTQINQEAGHGKTIGKMFQEAGWHLVDANKKRIPGKNAVHRWLQNNVATGYPILRIFSTCANTVRTLPALVYNTRKGDPEDVDDSGEDHCYDALRYAAMSEYATAPHAISPGHHSVASMEDDMNNRWEPNDYR